MATYKEAISRLREGLSCPLCYELFDTDARVPKALPCKHTLCLCCLERFVITNEKAPWHWPCPLCQSSFPVPKEGIRGLPTNTGYMGMLNLLPREEDSCIEVVDDDKRCTKKPIMCTIHDNAECSMFCIECRLPLCVKCLKTEEKHCTHEMEDICMISESMGKDVQQLSIELQEMEHNHDLFVNEMLVTFDQQSTTMKTQLREQMKQVIEKWQTSADERVEDIYHNLRKKFTDFSLDVKAKRDDIEIGLKQFTQGNKPLDCNAYGELCEIKSQIEELISFQSNKDTVISTPKFECSTVIPDISDIIGKKCITPLVLPLTIHKVSEFVKRDLNNDLYGEKELKDGAAWRAFVRFQLLRRANEVLQDKKPALVTGPKPMLFAGVECSRRGSGWKYSTKLAIRIFNYEKNSYEKLKGQIDACYTSEKRKWGTNVLGKDTMTAPVCKYVHQGTMQLLIYITVMKSE